MLRLVHFDYSESCGKQNVCCPGIHIGIWPRCEQKVKSCREVFTSSTTLRKRSFYVVDRPLSKWRSNSMFLCFLWGCRDGVVVRAFVSHQCDPGSIPRSGVICGLSLLVLYSAQRGFARVPGFPCPQKLAFDLICVYC